MQKFSAGAVKTAERHWRELKSVNDSGIYKPQLDSLKKHVSPEWFADAKFGMFYDWGLWSVAGYDEKGWNRARYPDTYLGFMYGKSKAYHEKFWGADFERNDFIPLLTGKQLIADSITSLAKRAGMKYIVPFLKHMDGYSLWNSGITQFNSVNLQPHRDFAAEIFAACKKAGLKYGAYFCLDEFQYPVIRNKSIVIRGEKAVNVPGFQSEIGEEEFRMFNAEKDNGMMAGKIPVPNFIDHYTVPLIKEFIDHYDPDILWYDAEWTKSAEYYKTPQLTAYFYNRAKKEVAVNDRHGKGTRHHSGDFYTSEFDEGDKSLEHPWEECRPTGESFGYYWADNDSTVLSANDLIELFVRIVAKNGNLLLMVCPDGSGKIPAYQVDRLTEMGDWLAINGEAIYGSRPYYVTNDDLNNGEKVWYTRSKDGKFGYAIFFEWPKSETVIFRNARPVHGKDVYLLGYDRPLQSRQDWVDTGEDLWSMVVKLPEELYDPAKRKGRYAWVVKFETR